MARVTCFLPLLTLIVCYTGMISTTTTTTSASSLSVSPKASTYNADVGSKTTFSHHHQSCSLLIPTEIIQCILGCAGLLMGSKAMSLLTKHRNLSKPFRILLSSLTLTDLLLSSSCLMTGILAFYTTIYWHRQGETTALSTTCSIFIGLYHSFLGCGVTTTLGLSVDRVLAVFAPVRYRAISLSGQTGKRVIVTLLPWLFAFVCVVALPLTWHFHSNRHEVELAGLSCWPLVAVETEFLFLQGSLLLVSASAVAMAHLQIIHKLSRRAILVVPMFGTRTADSTIRERKQTRRTVMHATSQACNFLLLYLSLSIYLLWMAIWDKDRRLEACEVRYLLLSQFPAVNCIINAVLTLWRFRKCPKCCPRIGDTPTNSQGELPGSTTNNAGEAMNQNQGIKTISSNLAMHTETTKPQEKPASQPNGGGDGVKQRKRNRTSKDSNPSCSGRHDVQNHPSIPDIDQSERSDSSAIYFPLRDDYFTNRANPDLLIQELTVGTSIDGEN